MRTYTLLSKITYLTIISLLAISCEDKNDHLCVEEISGYFKVHKLNNYAAIQTSASDENEDYTIINSLKYEEIENLRIVGQFATSNYGFINSDCLVAHGDLGCEEVSGRIIVTDVSNKRDLSSKCVLSEVEINSTISENNNFTAVFPSEEEEIAYEISLSTLNHSYYRMKLPNYVIQFQSGLTKKEYSLEVKYNFASVQYVDTVKFEIN